MIDRTQGEKMSGALEYGYRSENLGKSVKIRFDY